MVEGTQQQVVDHADQQDRHRRRGDERRAAQHLQRGARARAKRHGGRHGRAERIGEDREIAGVHHHAVGRAVTERDVPRDADPSLQHERGPAEHGEEDGESLHRAVSGHRGAAI